MKKVAVVVGILLVAQGVGFYFGTGSTSLTALIPSAVGLPILILGIVAYRESVRKHALHAATLFAMLGFLAAAGRIAAAGLRWSAAGVSLIIMIVLCGGFVALAVKSFVDVRRKRNAQQPETS